VVWERLQPDHESSPHDVYVSNDQWAVTGAERGQLLQVGTARPEKSAALGDAAAVSETV
jgi:hypothetical protein